VTPNRRDLRLSHEIVWRIKFGEILRCAQNDNKSNGVKNTVVSPNSSLSS
jgi:hypothetical protein